MTAPAGRPRIGLQRLELPATHSPGDLARETVVARLGQLRGVSRVVTSPLTGRAVVLFDPSLIRIESLLRAVTPWRVALPHVLVRWHLPIAGLACSRCAGRAEEAVGRVPGVNAVIANRSAQSLTIEFIAGDTDLEAVRTTLLAQGFDPQPAQPPASAPGGCARSSDGERHP